MPAELITESLIVRRADFEALISSLGPKKLCASWEALAAEVAKKNDIQPLGELRLQMATSFIFVCLTNAMACIGILATSLSIKRTHSESRAIQVACILLISYTLTFWQYVSQWHEDPSFRLVSCVLYGAVPFLVSVSSYALVVCAFDAHEGKRLTRAAEAAAAEATAAAEAAAVAATAEAAAHPPNPVTYWLFGRHSRRGAAEQARVVAEQAAQAQARVVEHGGLARAVQAATTRPAVLLLAVLPSLAATTYLNLHVATGIEALATRWDTLALCLYVDVARVVVHGMFMVRRAGDTEETFAWRMHSALLALSIAWLAVLMPLHASEVAETKIHVLSNLNAYALILLLIGQAVKLGVGARIALVGVSILALLLAAFFNTVEPNLIGVLGLLGVVFYSAVAWAGDDLFLLAFALAVASVASYALVNAALAFAGPLRATLHALVLAKGNA